MTLLEMAIVLVLLGIVAMMGLPTVTAVLEEARLDAAAQEVASALEFARTVAMTTGVDTRVTFDNAAGTIRVERWVSAADLTGGGATLAQGTVESGAFAPLGHPLLRGSDYIVDLAPRERFGGPLTVQASFGSGSGVRFQALGVPGSGGTVGLSLPGRSVTVTLAPWSGKVEVER